MNIIFTLHCRLHLLSLLILLFVFQLALTKELHTLMMRNLCPLTNVTSVSVNMEMLCALHVNAVSTFCSNYYYMVLPLFNEEAHVTYMTIYLKAAIVRLRNHARISFQQIVLGILA